MSQRHKLSFIDNFVAGAVAGTTEVLVMYPLDVIKTRQQIAVGKGQTMFQVFVSLIREAGFAFFSHAHAYTQKILLFVLLSVLINSGPRSFLLPHISYTQY
jgi:hypothetical protein